MKVRCLGVAASILNILAAAPAATADNVEHPECSLHLDDAVGDRGVVGF